MRIDGVDLINNSAISDAVIEFGIILPTPTNPQDQGRLYVLTQTQGPNNPGLYLYDGTAWIDINDNANIDAATFGGLNSTQFLRSDQADTISGLFTASSGVQVSDGSITFPSISFIGDSDTGLFSGGDGTVSFSSNGIPVLDITANATNLLNGELLTQNGNSSAPAYSFSNSATTGMYSPAANEIAFTSSGSETLRINDSGHVGIGINVPGSSSLYVKGNGSNTAYIERETIATSTSQSVCKIQLTSSGVMDDGFGPSLYFSIKDNDLTTNDIASISGIRDGGDTTSSLDFHTRSGGSLIHVLQANTGGLKINSGKLLLLDGTLANPVITFLGDPDTGIYLSGNNELTITTGGVSSVVCNQSNIRLNANTLGTSGSASTPSYGFTDDTNTGMYLRSSNDIAISTAGVERFSIDSVATVIRSGNLRTLNGSVLSPAYTFLNQADAGFYIAAPDAIGVSTAGVERVIFANSGLQVRTGQLLLQNGTAAAPTLSFSNDPDTGIYRSALNQLAFSANGAQRALLTTTEFNLSVQIDMSSNKIVNLPTPTLDSDAANKSYVDSVSGGGSPSYPNGSAGSPTHTFDADPDTGMYRASTNRIGFSTNGTQRLNIQNTAIQSSVQYLSPNGSVSAPEYSFTNDTDTGIYLVSTNELSVAAGGNRITTTNLNGLEINTGSLYLENGTSNSPSFRFKNDTNTGIYRENADVIGFTTGGQKRVNISNDGLIMDFGQLQFQNGTSSTPGICVNGNTNTGMYGANTNQLGFAAGGMESFKCNNNGIQLKDGTDFDPSLSFANDSNTGMYWNGPGSIGFTSFGFRAFVIDQLTVECSVPFSMAYGNITNLGSPMNPDDATPKQYVDDEIANGSPSSERYKKDIFKLTDEMADKVFDMLPVTYFSDITTNDQSKRHLGFTAEQLDDIGLHELVFYKDHGDGLIPEAVYYDRVSVLLTYIIKKQHNKVNQLTNVVDDLQQRLLKLEQLVN